MVFSIDSIYNRVNVEVVPDFTTRYELHGSLCLTKVMYLQVVAYNFLKSKPAFSLVNEKCQQAQCEFNDVQSQLLDQINHAKNTTRSTLSALRMEIELVRIHLMMVEMLQDFRGHQPIESAKITRGLQLRLLEASLARAQECIGGIII